MTDEQIKQMVNRFLCWKLPPDFHPDAGIRFEPHVNPGCTYDHHRDGPTGTNLLTASQAEAMIRHLMDGLE
ncbi:hypothetical protein [Novosphingobium sp. B1]|uniref:hypothetical protein n=1 Tax=Novosphingobium sp. B1 TaxID=1938756 RepID=UPI0009D8649D|nr:hypothetical protein [Novosphingobium sp. B1]SMD05625.1 hypothetical protein SAMN06272759_1304 [Novosphingobium sp. B1]